MKVLESNRVRLLDWQVSVAGQIFAPAKSAFTPSMALADFCSCKICIHAIHGACRFLLLQNLHSRHPWRLQIFAPAKSAFMPSLAISRRLQAWTYSPST
ncbi:MAG: hypothetical protein KJ725_05815 [Gammaproteobacteria bacterium]|nr:hypothetical protein [Gammaproteobacteria bacterium]